MAAFPQGLAAGAQVAGQRQARLDKLGKDANANVEEFVNIARSMRLGFLAKPEAERPPIEQFNTTIQGIRSQALRLAQAADKSRATQGLAAKTQLKFQEIELSATPEQKAVLAGQAEGAGKGAGQVAQAQQVARAVAGQPSLEPSLQAQGALPAESVKDIDPTKFTGESINEFTKTGDFSVLELRPEIAGTERAITKLETAALAVGVDPLKARSGQFTPDEAKKTLNFLASRATRGDTVNTTMELAAMSVGGPKLLLNMRAGKIDEDEAEKILKKTRENLGLFGLIFQNINPTDPGAVKSRLDELKAKSTQ